MLSLLTRGCCRASCPRQEKKLANIRGLWLRWRQYSVVYFRYRDVILVVLCGRSPILVADGLGGHLPLECVDLQPVDLGSFDGKFQAAQ